MAEASLLLPQSSGPEAVSNGLTNGVTNGTSNGHSDSSKHREKDKDRHKSSHRDKDRHSSSHKSSHKDKDKDKERHKSSSSSDKHKSSSSSGDKERSSDKDKHKSSSSSSGDKDRHREKDKDKHRSSSSGDKDKERSKDKDKDRSDKDKHRSSSSSKDKHSSSSSKDKDRHSSSDKDKHSSSDKDKHSSSDKDKHSSDRHKDDRDKKHSSSSSDRKDKDRHSSSKSSHKDKHRDKDRHREKDKDRHREERKEKERAESSSNVSAAEVKCELQDSSQNSTLLDTTQDTTYEAPLRDTTQAGGDQGSADSEEDNQLFIHVKEEPLDNSASSTVASESMKMKHSVDDEDDAPLASRTLKKEESEDDDDDLPLSARKRPKPEPKEEDDEDDDVPLAARKKPKKEAPPSDDDDVPLSARRKQPKKKRKQPASDNEDDDDFKPQKAKKAKVKKEKKPSPVSPKKRGSTGGAAESRSPTKKVKKETEEEKNVWKWWEEEKKADGRKWTFLEHKGVVFADEYERLPPNILMKYNGEPMPLSQDAEEVAGFYARMLEHDYVTKEQFNKNFFRDFRKVMTPAEREKITDLSKCNFSKMHTYFTQKNEERKNRTKEEKKALKEKNEELIKEFGWCTIDGHKQRIANFRAEPPGLFRGRGDHPKMGALKTRIMPEDVIINCSKDSKIPVPPEGHKWKEVRHDNQVTWLASWTENVQGQTKYVMMNAASKLKGEKDWQKYETARRLHQIADRIRDQYKLDWKSKEMRIRQRSVALYFIDKLALRAGNEKDEDQADTVGCCSLRVEHITLYDEKDGKECVVAFDFLGKDSIRYYNEVPVEKRAFKNLRLFMENKAPGDDLFDRLNTQIMNKHLNELMEGLTAKVFRTYNASRTLQEQLNKLTDPDDDLSNKVLSYNRANREVAILCNHQRAVPKTFDQSMSNLQKKIDDKKELIEEAKKDLKTLTKQAKMGGSIAEKSMVDKKKKHLERLNDQLHKLEIAATDKEENKQIALGTSKLNYLDPRISVAWCKKHDVPLEKVYNKTQRLKFQWAIEMATEDYDFMENPKSKPPTQQNYGNDDEEEEMDEDNLD